MATYKYNIGDRILVRDSYYGKLSGTITMLGKQGNKNIYGYACDLNGGHGHCKENEIIKKL